MNTIPLDYLCCALSPLFTYFISTYVVFTFLSCLIIPYLVTEFCINTSSVVLIGFCQSDEYLPRVKLSIILHFHFPVTSLSAKGKKGRYNFVSDGGFCQGLVDTKLFLEYGEQMASRVHTRLKCYIQITRNWANSVMAVTSEKIGTVLNFWYT